MMGEANDINKLRTMNATLHEIPLCDNVMTFYYDETGNCGKLILRDSGVNSPSSLSENFILGGVAFIGDKCPISPETLISELKLQSNELKFKNIYTKRRNFLDFMETPRISSYINWLYDSDLYIYYATINNLYYALVDMVDSLWESQLQFCFSIEWIIQLKSVLYNFCRNHLKGTLNLFYKYHYPNIERNQTKNFCLDFCNFIQKYNEEETNHGFFLECFRQMLKAAGRFGELVFLHDNENNILVDGYWSLYQGRCATYKNAFHHFDFEKVILAKFKEFPMIENNSPFINYDFIDSKQNRMIQVCDVFVGFMAKLFKFLDEISFESIIKLKKECNNKVLENFRKIYTLIIRSENFHKMMIANINDINLIKQRFLKLKYFATTDISGKEDLLNQLVYELYGLTPEEIDIVEGK